MAEAAPPDRVVLVGFMGSGKSTVGPVLARLLGWAFLDMDRLIEERAGLTVAEIFRERGEGFFREEEREVAREIATLRHQVVAAGGGAFSVKETRELLQAGALTVWLRCDLETILARAGSVPGVRPVAGGRETMRQLLVERESSYRLADLTVDGSDAPAVVARRIAEAAPSGAALRARRTIDP